MPNDTISQYLDAFERIGKFVLVTNDVFPLGSGLNEDTHDGGWRAIDIRKPPFSRKSFVLNQYHNFNGGEVWVKEAHLLFGQSI